MKPLKIYARTTLIVSLILASVLLAVVYLFVTRAREIELQDQMEQARVLVLTLVNSLPEISPDLSEVRKNVIAFRKLNGIQQVRIYDKTLQKEIVQIPDTQSEEIPDKELSKLGKRDAVSVVRKIKTRQGVQEFVYAVAPLVDNNRITGAVSITIKRQPFSDLSQRLIWLTVALVAVAIFSITAVLYILFSQVLYRPVEQLLRTMSQVETGNLEITAPVPNNDEFGQLATGFNKMIHKLRLMTEERQRHQKQLEQRVTEATAELAERNSQLEEANAELFEIQRELTKFERLAAAGQLAAQFAHEVGTPLNLISGHVQLLSARTDDQKTKERLEVISSQIARIEKIVRNMLDSTRRPKPTLAPIDLNALLQRIFEVTAPSLAARNVELAVSLGEGIPLVLGDSEQLQQVFINLINNSLDAMPQGGQLYFDTRLESGVATIVCRDSGSGISSEIRNRIFEPLFTTKLSGKGSGLGLTVVQQIVQEHGGSITVSSEAGRGTEFQIALPLAVIPDLNKPAIEWAKGIH